MQSSSVSLRHLTCQSGGGKRLGIAGAPARAAPPRQRAAVRSRSGLLGLCRVRAGYVAHGFYPGQAASHQSTPGCPVTAPSPPLRHRHHADQGDLRAPLSVIGGLGSGGSVDKNAGVAAEGVQTASCGQATIDRLLPSNFSLPSSCPDGAKERGAA